MPRHKERKKDSLLVVGADGVCRDIKRERKTVYE